MPRVKMDDASGTNWGNVFTRAMCAAAGVLGAGDVIASASAPVPGQGLPGELLRTGTGLGTVAFAAVVGSLAPLVREALVTLKDKWRMNHEAEERREVRSHEIHLAELKAVERRENRDAEMAELKAKAARVDQLQIELNRLQEGEQHLRGHAQVNQSSIEVNAMDIADLKAQNDRQAKEMAELRAQNERQAKQMAEQAKTVADQSVTISENRTMLDEAVTAGFVVKSPNYRRRSFDPPAQPPTHEFGEAE